MSTIVKYRKKSTNKSTNRSFVIFIAFLGALIVIPVFIIIISINLYLSFREANVNWAKVQGEVISAKYEEDTPRRHVPEYYIDVKYKYSYNNNTYSNRATVETYSDFNEVKKRLEGIYLPGASINVLVDPNDPGHSRLPFQFRTFGDSEKREFAKRLRNNTVNNY